jgi:predicted TIM-barrel fold metal-dependent hydrolase
LIDAHVHIWQLGANDCAWPTADLPAIHRDHMLVDFENVAKPLGVTGAILVQSQESARDTRWLLEQGAGARVVAGVVGWADLSTRDIGPQLDALLEAGPLIGLRPMVQDLAANWFDDPAISPRSIASRAAIRHCASSSTTPPSRQSATELSPPGTMLSPCWPGTPTSRASFPVC